MPVFFITSDCVQDHRLIVTGPLVQRLPAVLREGPRPTQISILVSPEEGFTDQEVDAAKRCGYQAVALGPRTLRSETSALVALSVIQSGFD